MATLMTIDASGITRAAPDDPEEQDAAPTVVGNPVGGPVGHHAGGPGGGSHVPLPPLPPSTGIGGAWVPLAIIVTGIVALGVAAYLFAVPIATSVVLAFLPQDVDRAIGNVSFASMDGTSLRPSRLDPAQQTRLKAALAKAVDAAEGDAALPTTIEFRTGDMGPNAFALPGGRIVVTDELVSLVDGREDVIVGVLGHEYGHVKGRHGVRMVAQSMLLRAVIGALFGDVSGLLAGAPAVLGEQAYSRDAEREADAESVRVLRAGGYSPAAMVVFFDKLKEKKLASNGGMAIAFASHPADDERVNFFRQAATNAGGLH